MKNQHTPGQWLAHIDINPNDSGLNDIRILETSTDTENLTANTIAVLNQNMGREAIANAHLIASAPDLLSAVDSCLEIMIRAIGERLPINKGTECEETDWLAAIRKARAAIAKAEGVA